MPRSVKSRGPMVGYAMRRLGVFAAVLFLVASCDEATEVAQLDEAEARAAMMKGRDLGYSDVCAAAMFNESKEQACEEDMQARRDAFRFELKECKPGATDAQKARFGASNKPMICTVRWGSDLEQTRPLFSSVVLFHEIDDKLQADVIKTAR